MHAGREGGLGIHASVAVFTVAAILLGATGLSCDSDAAATFRQTAAQPIGDGVKTVMNGILDGVIAAVKNAGDGSSSGSSGSSSTSNTSTTTGT